MRVCFLAIALVVLAAHRGLDANAVAKSPQFEFTRMVAHWAKYSDPAYLPFIKAARPEVVQFGFYGGHFWSLAHTPQYKGYPAHFPFQGLKRTGDWFESRNSDLHKLDAKVIGHFNVEFLVGDPSGFQTTDEGKPSPPRGFFHFYQNLWDEKELGPKPVEDPVQLLERDVDGKPIVNNSYSIGGMREYWACLRNPHWQAILKAWVKRGIEQGIDGYIANYFYRHDCHCEHCQSAFRRYLSDRFSADELARRFEISNLNSHKFNEIVYWHKPEESTALRREMLRWSQISNKQVFDEVFHRYGRKLKPDLITAQWNHLGNFTQIRGDERCLLPAKQWGADESYAWYSTGGAACYTDLENRYLGEGTLQARYIRGAFNDKPFTLGKYEGTRIRVAIAELIANGGAPMGFYTRFTDPEARDVIARYYQFIKRFEPLFRANRPHAEAALLFPRKAVHDGDVESVEKFRSIGTTMLDQHLLFDVLPDDLVTEDFLARFQTVVNPAAVKPQQKFDQSAHSQFDLPWTVRVSASRPHGSTGLTLHFVNYNRKEPPKGRNGKPSTGRGIADEKPIPCKGGNCDVIVPEDVSFTSIHFLTPERDTPQTVTFKREGNRVQFRLPEFFVYGVVTFN